MSHHDMLIRHYDHAAFQTAFKAYFGELGCCVTDWEGLFLDMTESGDGTWLRLNEQGRVIGFIQFAVMDAKSWFFETKGGFIREFWVDAAHRRQGHGSELLTKAEASLAEEGCTCLLLTTSTAPAFYRRRGYTHRPGIRAKNREPVFVKLIG